MTNWIINNYFIPVEIKKQVGTLNTSVDKNINYNYLLYKCVKSGDFYVFKLTGCHTKDIPECFDKIIVFSLFNYHEDEYYLIKRDDLFKNSFINDCDNDIDDKELLNLKEYRCIAEFEKIAEFDSKIYVSNSLLI